ncbi:pimeloyl-ACP methyl ester carboxylesterase [Actinomycetospora succinea]|uniref:Pimeloyl-ACP methyl ester carboxylesterase n=1 Tax=Actinomycetospora succinea TaxID=663603 RepID=A0A4R6VKY8_9PSEU|nr:alpha/beta fold hydrolase [Actinomycetospora succinea]TDQ62519.1 pimeloyl-ACP methyl ester carboxylesterase [Actinomycetospora succinea]
MTVTDVDPATPPVQRRAAGSGEIAYRRAGQGRPVLLLHSAGGANEWGPLQLGLTGTADLIAPDHPGFGLSDDLPELHTVDDLVYHYLDLLDGLGLAQVDVVGVSFGGWVAAELAMHSPERVRRLVLGAAVGLRVPEAPIADLFLMNPPQLMRALFHDDALVSAALAAEPTADQILATYRDLGALARFGWHPFLNDPKLERRLHRITAPTLVLAAGEDRLVPRVHAERYAAAIPDARLRVVPDCGHAMHGEKPAEVTAAVLEHLGS